MSDACTGKQAAANKHLPPSRRARPWFSVESNLYSSVSCGAHHKYARLSQSKRLNVPPDTLLLLYHLQTWIHEKYQVSKALKVSYTTTAYLPIVLWKSFCSAKGIIIGCIKRRPPLSTTSVAVAQNFCHVGISYVSGNSSSTKTWSICFHSRTHHNQKEFLPRKFALLCVWCS